MKRARSISHAPDPRTHQRAQRDPETRGAWTLCRKFESFPVRDSVMLQRWAEQGRVRPDDYLVSLELDLCVQARDVAELDPVFRKARARLLCKVWRGLACAALALALIEPIAGAAILLSALAAAIVCSRTARRDLPHSLSATDAHLRHRRTADCDFELARPA